MIFKITHTIHISITHLINYMSLHKITLCHISIHILFFKTIFSKQNDFFNDFYLLLSTYSSQWLQHCD
jgi:hypothetical protein